MHRYAIGIGSNRTRGKGRRPANNVRMALARLGDCGTVVAVSPLIDTAAIGPSDRRFINAACLIETVLAPPALLDRLHAIEREMSRRRARRWGERTIDLDILLWSGGVWWSRQPALSIPHASLPERRFVLIPLVAIAPAWRLPDGRRVRHLAARLTRPTPFHRTRPQSGP